MGYSAMPRDVLRLAADEYIGMAYHHEVTEVSSLATLTLWRHYATEISGVAELDAEPDRKFSVSVERRMQLSYSSLVHSTVI